MVVIREVMDCAILDRMTGAKIISDSSIWQLIAMKKRKKDDLLKVDDVKLVIAALTVEGEVEG